MGQNEWTEHKENIFISSICSFHLHTIISWRVRYQFLLLLLLVFLALARFSCFFFVAASVLHLKTRMKNNVATLNATPLFIWIYLYWKNSNDHKLSLLHLHFAGYSYGYSNKHENEDEKKDSLAAKRLFKHYDCWQRKKAFH